jgi:anti-sigma regulatory factor (Ser/Thr protein kinase)
VSVEQHTGDGPGSRDGTDGRVRIPDRFVEPRRRESRMALRLALTYAAAASAWIVLSDRALGWLGLSPAIERDLSSVKGLAFVLVTATLLYVLAVRYAAHLRASEERYERLFDNAAEGLTVYRVSSDGGGRLVTLTVADMNPAEKARHHTSGERVRSHRETVDSAVAAGRAVKAETHLVADDTDELLSVYPIGDDLWALAAVDITEVRRAERALRRQDEEIRRAYVDVIDAVTGGRLILLSEEDLSEQLGMPLGPERTASSPADLSRARHEVTRVVTARHPAWTELTDLMTPLCEALTNAVTHADGGTYQLFEKGDRLQVVVGDEGPGIDFRTLPKATLTPGFSTAASLGVGFTIMLNMCDRVLLSTRPGSTRVVLELHVEKTPTLERVAKG